MENGKSLFEINTDTTELVHAYKHYRDALGEKIKKDITEMAYALGGEFDIHTSCDYVEYCLLIVDPEELERGVYVEVEHVDGSMGLMPISDISNTDALIAIWEEFLKEVDKDFEFLKKK